MGIAGMCSRFVLWKQDHAASLPESCGDDFCSGGGEHTAVGIALSGLHLTLGGHSLFSDFNLDLPGGQWTCILGKSGLGKTSLLRMIAGLLAPDGGAITEQPMECR